MKNTLPAFIIALLGFFVSSTSAFAAETQLLSYVPGKTFLATSNQPSMDADGNIVAFTSTADGLVNDGTINIQQIYVKNIVNNSFIRISVNNSGTKANAISFNPSISADGNMVAFYSLATNLVDADNNNVADIFVHNVSAGTTQRISTSSTGAESNAESSEPVISANGRFVVFSSLATNFYNLSFPDKRNVYVKDLQTGQLEIISVNDNGDSGDGDSFRPSISGDGRYVVFSSMANNLDTNAPDNNYDIFIRDRLLKKTEKISLAKDGSNANGHSGQASISEDGSVVSFISLASNLVNNDTNNQIDIFVYNRTTKSTTRIVPAGTQANGPSFSPKISGNNRFIAFYSSASNWISGDKNNYDDLYVYDRYANTFTLASVANDDTQGSSNIGSIFSINNDGSAVVFSTASAFDSLNDTNKQIDVYLRKLDLPPNIAPVAIATPVAAQSCSNGGANVTLDASSSYDLDQDPLQYTWKGPFGSISGKTANVFLGPGNNSIELSVTDPSGAKGTDATNVAITDTVSPVINTDTSVTVEATDINGTPYQLNYVATDNCELSNVQISPTMNLYPLGSTIVSIAATDILGNIAQTTTQVNVVDTTPPQLSVPQNIVKEATAILTPVDIGTASASDIFPTSVSNNSPVDYPLGTTNVTWTATDSNGNTTSKPQQISVKDTTPPRLNIPADMTMEANASQMKIDIGNATASDIFPVTITNNSPGLFNLGTTKVLWTATDSSGNKTSLTQNIALQDTIPPELTMDNSITLEASAIDGTPYNISYQVSDNCIDCGNITVTRTPDLSVYPLGTTDVTVSAMDSSQNITQKTISVKVQDTTPPIIGALSDINVEANAVSSSVDLPKATATDIFPVTISSDAPATFPLGSTVVTWTATDANGNKSTTSQKVTVKDTTAPVLKLPANITLEANAVSSTFTLDPATGSDIFPVTISSNAPDTYPLGTTNITWTVTDSSGNRTSGTQTITVVDTTAPVLKLPADITLEANAVNSHFSLTPATGTDIFPVTITNDAPDTFPLGATKITWTATDSNGNSVSDIQTINVVDTTSPILTAPVDQTIEATGKLTPVNIGQAKASDIFPVTISNNAPASFPLGKTLVQWIATDQNGNQSTATQLINIVDTTPPVVDAGSDVILEATSIQGAQFKPNYSASDICDCGPLSISIQPALNYYSLGEHIITIKVTDISGNTGSDSMKLVVRDTTKPTLSIPSDMLVEATGLLTPVSIGTATASDIFPVTITNNSPAQFALGTTSVTWTATDANGNSTQTVQHIAVVDTTAPTFGFDQLKTSLWPANHKMKLVAKVYSVHDAVDVNPAVNIQVSSNFDHERKKEEQDWKIVQQNGVWEIWLRAEKANHQKKDRIYTINISIIDFSGNQASQTAKVVVPHDHNKSHESKQEKHKHKEQREKQ